MLKKHNLDMSIRNNKNESIEDIYKKMKENNNKDSLESEMKNEYKNETDLESILPELYFKNDVLQLPFYKRNKHYEELKLISSDLVGSIYKCKWYGHIIKSHKMVIINIDSDNCKLIYEMINEWSKERIIIHHPGIVETYGIIFEMKTSPIILEEYLDYNLYDLIISKKKISFEYLLEIIKKIVNILLFLNSFKNPVVCGSVVPSSIYINEELNILKIDDIGLYKIYENTTRDKFNYLYLRSDTFKMSEREINDDLYSLGICIIELNINELINGDIRNGISDLKNVELKPLVQKCLNV